MKTLLIVLLFLLAVFILSVAIMFAVAVGIIMADKYLKK